MPDDSKHDRDTIGRVAQNAEDRRDALEYCLTHYWSVDDISKIERRDKDGWNGWDMWRKP